MTRGRPISVKVAPPTANATAQRKAFKKLSLLERETGMSHAEWDEFHRVQRERVMRRYGLDVA